MDIIILINSTLIIIITSSSSNWIRWVYFEGTFLAGTFLARIFFGGKFLAQIFLARTFLAGTFLARIFWFKQHCLKRPVLTCRNIVTLLILRISQECQRPQHSGWAPASSSQGWGFESPPPPAVKKSKRHPHLRHSGREIYAKIAYFRLTWSFSKLVKLCQLHLVFRLRQKAAEYGSCVGEPASGLTHGPLMPSHLWPMLKNFLRP